MNDVGYEIGYPCWYRIPLREWWRYRELFWFMAWRDIQVRYKQTLLGIGWAILQPLSLMILFSVFWRWGIRTETPAPYPVFVYSGLLLWGLFSAGVGNASASMISQANVIKKVYFPRIIAPTAAIIVALLDFFLALLVFLALLAFYRVPLSLVPLALYSPLAFAVTIFATLGAGLLLAAVNIRYRDARHAIPFLLQALFFATPVIFPCSVVKSEILLFFLSLNPMAAAIHLARAGVGIEAVNWQFAMVGMAASMVLLVLGLALFSRNEIECADVL